MILRKNIANVKQRQSHSHTNSFIAGSSGDKLKYPLKTGFGSLIICHSSSFCRNKNWSVLLGLLNAKSLTFDCQTSLIFRALQGVNASTRFSLIVRESYEKNWSYGLPNEFFTIVFLKMSHNMYKNIAVQFPKI